MPHSPQNKSTFTLAFKVRDYECDMQGIVNNAVYMNYLEHARHEYLDNIGFNFKVLLDKGIYLVAIKAELEYKKMLISGQNFIVSAKMQIESKLKVKFYQEIINDKQELVLLGMMTAAILDKKNKPMLVQDLFEHMGINTKGFYRENI